MHVRCIKIMFALIHADIEGKMNGKVERCGYEVRGDCTLENNCLALM